MRGYARTFAALTVVVGGCSLPVPSPSGLLEPSQSPAEAPLPTPDLGGRVVVRVLGQTLAYDIATCPIPAWLDPSLDDGLDFGSYPTRISSDDGSMWITNMFVLDIARHRARDWSFVLTSDSEGTPTTIERLLTSPGGEKVSLHATVTRHRAMFRTIFTEAVAANPTVRQHRGTVIVTC